MNARGLKDYFNLDTAKYYLDPFKKNNFPVRELFLVSKNRKHCQQGNAFSAVLPDWAYTVS